jgi:predicted CopG family antitoxin
MADTTPRAIRISDDLWEAALAKAKEKDETVSDVVRRALERYVRR